MLMIDTLNITKEIDILLQSILMKCRVWGGGDNTTSVQMWRMISIKQVEKLCI